MVFQHCMDCICIDIVGTRSIQVVNPELSGGN